MKRTGGQLIVEALEANKVERVFCVPGESYLAVLDALHDSSIKTVVCRQEGGAAMMADCEGRLTGRPGICFVTRVPGATHAANVVHTAMQDSTPMILFIGQVDSAFKGREAFQEVDYRQMFGGLAKWATEIDDIRRTIVRQTMFAEFEKVTHELVERNQPLTLEAIKAEYRKLLDAYFGPA